MRTGKRIEFVEVDGLEPATTKLLAIGAAPDLTIGASYLFPIFETVDPETSEIVRVLRPDIPILLLREDDS